MDDLDRKILSLLAKNARMPVKEIAEQVSLTSPGRVQPHPQTGDGRHHQRLHRHPEPPGRPRVCGRLISLVGGPSKQDAFLELLQTAARCCSATTSPVPIPSWSR